MFYQATLRFRRPFRAGFAPYWKTYHKSIIKQLPSNQTIYKLKCTPLPNAKRFADRKNGILTKCKKNGLNDVSFFTSAQQCKPLNPLKSRLSAKEKGHHILSKYDVLSGGGGESRTHVRKRFLKNFSERSWCFVVSPHPTPISRLRIRLSYCSPMLLGAHIGFSCMFDVRSSDLQVNRSWRATA